MNKHISIKKLSPDDQPREKLLEKGRSAVSDAEILAILIGSGNREKTAVQLSQEILIDVNNDLNNLAKLSVKELTKFKGIGEAKAITIAAALELGRRRKASEFDKTASIKSAADVFTVMSNHFHDLEHEEFYALYLSRSNKIKSIECISKGGISGTVSDGKLIFKKALENTASSIIICHNHPSGNLNPSKADKDLTESLKKFGGFIDLPILDHVIITNESYFSFADKGLM